jgi:hypothetical protein
MGRHALVPLLRALRVRVGALAQRDRRLYVGCADGTVRVYEMPEDTDPVKRDSSAASADEAEGKAGDTAGTEETETEETDKDTEATTTEAETEAHEPEPTLLASHALAKGAITALAVLPAARRLAVLSGTCIGYDPVATGQVLTARLGRDSLGTRYARREGREHGTEPSAHSARNSIHDVLCACSHRSRHRSSL